MSIEVCAAEVSGLMVRVVGVLAADGCEQIERHAGDRVADHVAGAGRREAVDGEIRILAACVWVTVVRWPDLASAQAAVAARLA